MEVQVTVIILEEPYRLTALSKVEKLADGIVVAG
jgi:hypothetical protein